jgi:regulator of sirC expression with transglutaminase-like and TPR domain
MSGFRTVAGRSCASHEGLALALADELGCDTAGAPEAVRALARFLPATEDAAEMLAAVARLSAERLGDRSTDVLLLPEVLRRGGGDPAGVAVAAAVVAQTAGYAIGLVGCGNRLLVAHHFSDDTLVIDPAAGLIDARTVGFDLHWRCAHESAAVILDRASERAERRGELTTAIAAQALALALPLEESSRAVREATHRRLLSRFN